MIGITKAKAKLWSRLGARAVFGQAVLEAAKERDDFEMNACLPGCVWNATPRSWSPLERNLGFWTQA